MRFPAGIRLDARQRGTNARSESTPIARTAIIEAIDKANRTVTLKGSAGNGFPVRAPEGMEGFDSLKVGPGHRHLLHSRRRQPPQARRLPAP